METSKDKIKGNFNSTVGKAKQATGAIGSDIGQEGTFQRAKGGVQKKMGELKDEFKKGARKLGDKIEHLGDNKSLRN